MKIFSKIILIMIFVFKSCVANAQMLDTGKINLNFGRNIEKEQILLKNKKHNAKPKSRLKNTKSKANAKHNTHNTKQAIITNKKRKVVKKQKQTKQN